MGAILISKKQYNIALVAHSDGICFMDIDLVNGKFMIPQKDIDDLIEKYDTLTVMTKSGGYRLYFINDELTRDFVDNGFAENPKLMYQGKDSGEIRTNNQYVLIPGSFVPLDYDKKGSVAGATGLYKIIRESPIRKLNIKILPKWFVVEQSKKKLYKREKIKSNIDVNKISAIKANDIMINDVGLTLEEVREKDPELDKYLKEC